MLRSVRSRIRLGIGALGCAVLAASLVSWVYSQHAAAGRYTWVKVDSSHAAAAETAELWHVSATCVRPYFVRALLRSKAKLQAHYNAAPDEVRARLNPGVAPGQSVKPAAWHPRESGRQEDTGRSNPYGEYVAALQVKYAEWYAALFKLEIAAGNWQQRLIDVADQTVVLSATSRASFATYSRGDMKLTGSPGDFDGHLLTALGLGGFSSDEQAALKSDCVTIDLVKQSLANPNDLGALWRWPLDCLAEFSFGLELVLIAIFFAPIALWLGTGDLEVRPHIRALADRLGVSIQGFDTQFVRGMLERVRHMRAVSRS
jgi:hypothetical protein